MSVGQCKMCLQKKNAPQKSSHASSALRLLPKGGTPPNPIGWRVRTADGSANARLFALQRLRGCLKHRRRAVDSRQACHMGTGISAVRSPNEGTAVF